MRKINFDIKRKINNKKKKNMFEVKKSSRPINKKKKTNDKKLFEIMEKRFNIIIGVICVLFLIIISRVFYLQILKNDEYTEKLSYSTEKKIESTSSPRGRIYDRNYNLLVDNEAVKTIYYKKKSGVKAKEEIELAYTIGDNISIDYSGINDTKLKDFYYKGHYEECRKKITDKEWDLYSKRKLTDKDILKLIYERIDDEISEYDERDKKAAYIYYLMNKGYSYAEKVIKNKDVTEEEYAYISENIDNLNGFNTKLDWERVYLYDNTFKTILGSVSSNSQGIPEELAKTYLKKGYSLDDRVGISYLEYQYEDYLKGTKATYRLLSDNSYELVSEGKRGNDIVLTIDINLQKSIYHAIEDEVTNIFMQYFTPGSNKITYNSSGDVDTIYITAQEAYFALIDNNLVSLKGIQEQNTSNEADIYSQFEAKKAETLSWLREELTSGNTAYGKLSEEQKLYIWYIYDLLRSENIFSLANVDTSDSVYYDWIYGDSTSLSQLLTYGISKNWINMSSLTSEKYTSLQESYDVLVDYVISALDTDTAFFKKMYKYMINAGSISGRQVCMLLYEQGVLDMNADDSKYQSLASGSMGAYEFMSYVISNKIITVGQLALKPCSGSAVVTNPDNGDVLALVSYPSYDNNKLSGTVDAKYYSSLVNDNASPLLNRATQSFIAPGSTYKPCTIIAGIDSGIISSSTTFNCSGVFDKVTPSPRCWQKWGHGSETPVTAIRDSCNVYMYNVGYNLACSKNGSYNSTYGTNILKKYSDMLGLSTKTGIEIEEGTPGASSQNAIASAIGQGNHRYSTLNLARYVTTLATSGTCYNLTLIDKITDYDGNVIMENHAEVNNQVELSSDIWNTIHTGMNLAAGTYSAFLPLKMPIAAKTGTAQERTTDPDHATLISYAPYDNPQYCMAVRIQNGYASGNAVTLGSEIYKMLFNIND